MDLQKSGGRSYRKSRGTYFKKFIQSYNTRIHGLQYVVMAFGLITSGFEFQFCNLAVVLP